MAAEAPGVCSVRAGRASGLTFIDRAVRLIEQAGAEDEDATARDGFLSHNAETHAAGGGMGLGFLIAASGNLRHFGLLYLGVILLNRGDVWLSGALLEDVRSEMHYFLGGLIAGALLGLLARLALEVAVHV